jgi:hypothetical protein
VLSQSDNYCILFTRYGKYAVLDLLDIEDSWTALKVKFEEVKKGLLCDLLSKELLKEEK